MYNIKINKKVSTVVSPVS